MDIKIKLDNNYLPDKYGKHADTKDKENETPIISFPFEINNIPKGCKSLAITLVDYDSIPVSGFAFIHWLACNLPADLKEIPENLSREPIANMVQGKNSKCSRFFPKSDEQMITHYVGPMPPDQDHDYTLCVYALDSTLALNTGYYLNEFRKAIKGKVIEKCCIDIKSRV